jgi:hypothetical protein
MKSISPGGLIKLAPDGSKIGLLFRGGIPFVDGKSGGAIANPHSRGIIEEGEPCISPSGFKLRTLLPESESKGKR